MGVTPDHQFRILHPVGWRLAATAATWLPTCGGSRSSSRRTAPPARFG